VSVFQTGVTGVHLYLKTSEIGGRPYNMSAHFESERSVEFGPHLPKLS